MCTLQTRVPAFQRAGGLTAVRWKEPDDEDSAESDGGCGIENLGLRIEEGVE